MTPQKQNHYGRGNTGTILLNNIRQLLTLRGPAGPRRGRTLRELGIINDAAVLCAGGKIVCVGTRAEAKRDGWLRRRAQVVQEIDCGGGVALPGFVDAHTHPAFMQPRLLDFEQRTAGASYEQIAERGGGIRLSVEAVRGATRGQLAGVVLAMLERMAAHGTTTVEAKSGYGLSMEAELKSLAAIREAARHWPGTVVSTLLGAHAVPHEYLHRADDYVDIVCKDMIPAAARRKLAEYVDVFVEREAFTREQAERVAAAGTRLGMGVRAHVSQMTRTPLTSLLALKPSSLDHLDRANDADIRAIARSSTVATMLPASNYFLGLRHYPPARQLIDAGAAVALATDYNPGTAPTFSMSMVLSIACTQMGITVEEAVSAATINGACSLGLASRKGSIEPGKDADLAWFAVKDYREIPYWFGANLCSGVCMNGEIRFVSSECHMECAQAGEKS